MGNIPTIKDIVAYPVMDESDYKKIMEFRRIGLENPNPIEKIVYPYFSFHEQLSVDDENLENFIQTLENRFNKDLGAFNFTIGNVIVFDDDIAGCNLGLVAMKGLSEFLRLSSLIYATIESLNDGNVFQSLYLPNIHIAYRRYYKDIKNIMDNLNMQDIEIKGRIDRLSIREYEAQNTKVIHEFTLKS